MSDLVSYHPTNPDPHFGGCRNTGREEDGVTFNGIEPVEGSFCFVGRQSILEAAGELYGLGPKQVVERLSADSKPQEKIKDLEARLREAEAKLAARERFFEALREQGFIAPEIS